jgi:hypothetical protein
MSKVIKKTLGEVTDDELSKTKIELTIFEKKTKKSPRCRVFCNCGCKKSVDIYYLQDGVLEINGACIPTKNLLDVYRLLKAHDND